jgi:hypothetical protein
MNQFFFIQQNNKSGQANIRKNLTNLKWGKPNFDLLNNAKKVTTRMTVNPGHPLPFNRKLT